MREATINLYAIDELTEDKRKKVIEKHRHINVDYDRWYDFIEDKWINELKSLGYEDIKIYFSGFGSQGDGACFVARINIEKWTEAHKKKSELKALLKWQKEYGDITAYITHNYRYYFSTSTNVHVDQNNWTAPSSVEKQLDELTEYLKHEREELGNKIYEELQDAYSDLTSDESVAETLRINEYEYLENGQQINV